MILLFSCQIPPTREKFIKLMEMKAHDRYAYNIGQSYPLHRTCSNFEEGAGDSFQIVPKYMGWRWDEPIHGIDDKKWHPGHINKTVRCLMKHFLNPFPLDTLPLTRRDRFGRVVKTCNDYSQGCHPIVKQMPTLQIKKEDGEYCITMNPLKDKQKLETDYNPYLNCSPLKFKIKKHPEEIKKHRAKKILRERGFDKKCSCLNLKCCRCLDETTKKFLAFEMKKVSEKMNLKKELLFADLGDSSDSEVDMHFTTPSAVVDNRKSKPNVIHCGTQYTTKDFALQKIKTVSVDEKKLQSKFAKHAPKVKPK